MRLYPELPENYIEFVGDFYREGNVFQFKDGKDYAVIEPPNADGSWNHDVYSTTIALTWLYLAGENGKTTGRALKFLELASPRDDMSFDGDAYALISLSLYGGRWEENRPVPERKESEKPPLKLPAVFVAGVLTGVLMGILAGRRR